MSRCRCPRPRIFEEGRCHRCGREADSVTVTPSTMRIALAIAAYALGHRRGDGRGRRSP